MKQKRYYNIKIAIFAFVIWTILNITGISNIYIVNDLNFKAAIGKVLHLFFLYVLFLKTYNIFSEKKSENGKKRLKYFVLCFSILLFFLIIVWPGTWSWDDIIILQNISHLDFTPWQHFFSGLFYLLCLETIPIPAGVILIQVLIISLLESSILSKIETMYKKNLIVILMIIFFLPPLTLYALSGFRMGLYSFLELYLLIQMLYLYKMKTNISSAHIFDISLITIIVATWRTEGIYYILILPLFFLLFCRSKINKKAIIIASTVVIILTVSIMKLNNYMIGNNNYSLTSTINSTSELVKKAKDKDLIKKIDKVLDTKYILENQDYNGEEYFWSGKVVKEFTDKEYKEYLKAYVILSLKYPDKVIKSMWDIFFIGGNGIGEKGKQATRNMLYGSGTTDQLFDENTQTFEHWSKIPSNYKSPIFKNVRKKSILLLGGTNHERNIGFTHMLFWNYLIPIALILICIIVGIVKKDWIKVFLLFAIISRVFLLFIASPAPYFMYYLSVYLCGYVFFVLTFIELKNAINNTNNVKKKIIWQQIFQFIVVSGIGWCIDFSIYTFLTSCLQFKVLFANIISSIPAITYVFFMSKKRIFKNMQSKLNIKEKYIIYFGYQIVLLLIISSFGEFMHTNLIKIVTVDFLLKNLKLVIKIMITPITMTLNFIVMKNLIEKL